MVNNISEDDPGQGLACGARSFDCFSYVDPTNYERVGVKLVLQACICPAAVLAANVSLLDGEDEPTHAHGIPCADTFAIGPHGLEEYRRMCRSQLACGFMCMGIPVIYTENLIQRQRIRSKYGLRDPTSLSEIGAGCCYPCSIFQSHTFLYVSTHRPSKPRAGAHASHGPLSGALRAMHRTTSTSKQRSQDVASTGNAQRQESHNAGASSSCPKPIDPPRVSLHHSCTTPEKRPRQEAAAAAATAASGTQEAPGGCAASTSLPAAAAQRVPSASCIASGFGETPGLMVTSPRHEAHTNTLRPVHRVLVASPVSAESRSTPASSSIPPPEVTDSPPVGAAIIASTPEEVEDEDEDDGDEVSSALTDSASMPIPSALPVCTMALSTANFDFSSPQRPQTSLNSMAIEGPKQSQHISQTRQRLEGCRLQALEPAGSAGQPPVKLLATEPVASGMSASDVSLFSLALEPGMPSLPPPASTGGPTPSSGTTTASSAAARPGPGPAPAPLPAPPLPTPGSSRDLHPAAYDTITSSKLSSMIDHAMLNGSGSATGRGSGSAAGGGGTALSSIDPAGPWDIYRHSVMAPIAEGDAEEGQRSIGKVAVHLPISQDAAYATPDSDTPGSASAQRMSPTKSRTFPRHVKVPGSSAEPSPPGSSSLRSARGGRRGSGGTLGTNPITDPVCAGGAALTALARMGPEGGSHGTAAGSSGAGRLGNGLSTRKLRPHGTPPAPRRTPPPRAATLLLERATSTDGVRCSPQRVTCPDGADEDDDDLEDMSASADNFSLANALPSQLLLNGAVGQPPQRRGSSQGRYGGVAVERPVMAMAAAGVAPLSAKHRHIATGLVVHDNDDDDDEVNFASIRPSFIDGPEMAHLKSVLRAAGEQSVDGSEAVSVAPAAPPPPAGPVTMPTSGSQRVVALSSTVTALQQRGSGSRRYSNMPPAVPASSTAVSKGAVTDAAPYASYCGDVTSPEEITARDSVDEDASSIIDGPVSSGEGGSVNVTGPSGAATAVAATRAPRGGTASDPDDDLLAAGDASVSVAVAETRHIGGTPGDLAESTARSASGLSNGESNVGYESVADSVCASQHRQKHWVNWMAQSIGMSMVTSVANSSRAVFTGYGRSAGGPAGKACVPEPASSNLSVNQRIPRPVVEESSNGLFRQWG
ncbi:hypothetical protein Vafri_4384 [Volvox africanus]|uniref:Uncharacterized protein n=1 Tax=Volvox africanus TaxID=51714 RepID=A0A8J4AV83_9CHLO|nr:hypothetical protein Vafri_4384 [Volvox africanus]